jgi:betaine-aldehyde dehydrogenase
VKAYQMYIDGKFVNAVSGNTFNVYDPATEEVIATCPAAEAKDVARAVEAAKKAFYGGWRTTSAQERGRCLLRLADRLRARRDELARLETLNSGKPIVESEYDMDDSAVCFEYYGGLATKINGEVIPVPTNAMVMAIKEPMGVAGQIIPWNYPLAMAAWKLGPAIAAGCTVVIKPAEQTPLSLLELAKDFEACGIPPGVINVVTGMGPEAGGPIVAHPDVRKIAFTGSAEVGKIIMRSAADQLKRVSLELGGKSPNIFFSDSDFEAAVDGALFGVFINQGEVCSAGSRVLVQQDIYKKFVDACAAKAKTIRVGPGIERETKMGPLISAEQRDRVKKYLDIGKKEAKVAAGGGTPKGLGKGWYVEPTIFYDVDNSARIAQEEIFGPVMSVIPFKDEAHALEIANATPYGLAAAVWTRDIFKAFRVVKQLEAGIVWVNHMQPTMLEAPWGGYKMSGFGRELGHWGVEEYLETKQIYINLDEAPIGWY